MEPDPGLWGTFVRSPDRVALECSVVATCCRWPPNGRQGLSLVDVFYTGEWRFWVIQICCEFFVRYVVRLFAFVDLLGRDRCGLWLQFDDSIEGRWLKIRRV